MKTYEITIESIVFTNDFPTINKTICIKKIDPKAIFKEYIDIERISKHVMDYNGGNVKCYINTVLF